MQEIKPCAQCEKQPTLITDGICSWIECRCGIKTKTCRTREEAIKIWNRRPDKPDKKEWKPDYMKEY